MGRAGVRHDRRSLYGEAEVASIVGKRAVGIRLKCLLVNFIFT